MSESLTSSSIGKRQPRRSSLELLRIICMILIVAHHIGVHGHYGNMELSALNRFVINLLKSGGKLGVNVYMLISGYFLVNSSFKLKRLINTLALTLFYSVAIYFSFVFFVPGIGFDWNVLYVSVHIIDHNAYWFVTCYAATVVLSPFINKLIHAMNKREHLILIILLLVMQAAFPFFGTYIAFSNVGWFITLYVIAGYLRLYPGGVTTSKLATGLSSLALCLIVAVWDIAAVMTSIICLGASVALFAFFNNLDIKTNFVINNISRATFGVYLIHDNNLIREVIWDDILRAPLHAAYDSFWLFSIVAVLVVYVACTVIDIIRRLLLDLISLGIKKCIHK